MRENPVVASSAEDDQTAKTRNQVDGAVSGAVVQTGSLHGGVHIHQATPAQIVIPRQLPAAVRHFVGRDRELHSLAKLLGSAGAGAGTVVISAIDGTAGIGKTTLALHWAHQAADRFPDGQLYVNLRGFDPTSAPMPPAEAVRGFLDAFEVAPERIPVSLDAQAALYRSLLANRRVLVVLDNARDVEQIRPLLPGSATCLVLITSRNRLSSIVAKEGAHPLALDVLTPDEAIMLLAHHLGDNRIAAEPQAALALTEHCARLPLALSIVAARAATHPHFPLSVLVRELRSEQDRLDALDAGDRDTNVRATFSWSYRTLTRRAARLFRLLGLQPGPDVSLPAAASLAGVPTPQARALLAELTQARLLDESEPSRYSFHDLLRAYAAERAAKEDSEQDRSTAMHRILDYYLHTAFAAAMILAQHRKPLALDQPQHGVTPTAVHDYGQATSWFAAEHSTLIAAVEYAADNGFGSHAWKIPWTLTTFLNRRGRWHDWVATHETALTSIGSTDDLAARAQTHRGLGRAYSRLGRYDHALVHFRKALTLYRELDDDADQARTYYALSRASERHGRYEEALGYAQEALNLYRAAGNDVWQARTLNSVGRNHAKIGRYQQALTYCEQALEILRDRDDRAGVAQTLDNLGYAHRHLGQHSRAVDDYQQALQLFRELGAHYDEAVTLDQLGDTYATTGDQTKAQRVWQQALEIFERLGHTDSETVRSKLMGVDAASKFSDADRLA
ncbi:tetratricopeptide repeat protein [Streptomyces sp. NPDC046909]|uniref:ATP-binding protein n=1 Tax=Streptomyces sp. NPDC046909 TaxID=3155617 RepID=UPI0033F10E4E